MLQTLAQAKADTLGDIAGSCTNSDAFLKLLNNATRRLMRRGDWSGDVAPIHVCAYRGCVVFNRYVHQVRKINLCAGKTPITNIWGDFMDNSCTAWWHNELGQSYGFTASGLTPLYQDVMGDGRLIRSYTDFIPDVGKTITIFGVDNNGQPLFRRLSDGSWREGWTITTAIPYGVTSNGVTASPLPVRRIDRVVLDEMQGINRLYAFRSSTSLLEPLAEYMPGEINPQYQKYTLHSGCCGTTLACCDDPFTVIALVKLRFIPAKYDTDLVLIDNLDALKDYMQSLKFREAGDTESANEYEASALRELNLQLRDDMPNDQMPISMGELGGTDIGYQKVF